MIQRALQRFINQFHKPQLFPKIQEGCFKGDFSLEGRFVWVPVLFILLLIQGCGVEIVPKPMQGGEVDSASNIATKEKNGIRISVQSMEWRYSPYCLNEYFTPFLFLVRNNTDQKITLRYDQFVLLDEKGNQFNVRPPEMVEKTMATKHCSSGYLPYPAPYYGGFYYPSDSRFDLSFSYRGFFTDISLLSLGELEVLPGAQVRGFLYFQKSTTYGKDLRLKVSINQVSEDFEFEVR